MNLKKVRLIVYIFLAVGAVVMLAGSSLGSVFALMLGFFIMVGTIVFQLDKWRCPYCGEYLGRYVGKYCSHCGKKLDDLE